MSHIWICLSNFYPGFKIFFNLITSHTEIRICKDQTVLTALFVNINCLMIACSHASLSWLARDSIYDVKYHRLFLVIFIAL